jgi:hypothetical protein
MNSKGVSLVNASSTLRYDGIVIMIFIIYSNTITYNLDHISYSYQPSLITDTEFKSVEPTLINGTYREVYNRHGIRMIFIQDGTSPLLSCATILFSLLIL